MISRAVVLSVPGYQASSSGVCLRPAEDRERPERGREPGVEHVLAARQLGRAALGARFGLRLLDGEVPVGALPDRELVAPPDLSRDVPVGRAFERVDRVAMLRGRVVAHATLPQRGERRLLQLVHAAPPLQRDQRLNPALAALAERDRVPVSLALDQQTAVADPGEDPFLCLILGQPGELAGSVVHAPVGADHRQLGKLVRAADLEIERIVPGRHLESTRAELRIDPLVLDHGHRALGERNDHLAPHGLAPALVAGAHGDGYVCQDRRWTRCRDRDSILGIVRERVAHVRQRIVHLLVHELEVGQRRSRGTGTS